MKRILLALVLGSAVLGLAACGGDDDDGDGGGSGNNPTRETSSIADFLSMYESANQRAVEKFDEVAPEIAGDDAPLDERKSTLVAFLEEIRDIARERVDDFEDIDPPDEAQGLHGDLVQAGNDFVDAIDGVIEDVEEFDSLSDIVDFDTPGLDSANERLDEVCAELQQLADDEGIEADLGCD